MLTREGGAPGEDACIGQQNVCCLCCRGLFRMNDRSRRYEPEAMARIYRQSKIIVNIARDDFSQDTNLTTIEEMPEAALLLTSLPAEPAQIGFEDGVHFVVFRKEA